MTKKVIKAVIYCRVSSRSQELEGHGLESQETRCRQFAESKGYEIAAVFPDTMTGGGSFMQRPGMVAMLGFLDAQPGEDFVVIFDDLKRASRDTRAFLDLRDAFRLRGVGVECLNYTLGESAEDEFVETVLVAQGALERRQNGLQVSQKMQARMQSGYWVHDAPIGLKYVTVKGRGKMLVPNEPFASIIREAFEGYASGRFQSQAEVKRHFESFPDFPRNKHGLVTQQTVTRILTQPVYTGHICSERYGLNWLKAQHEPLVSLETFDKVQERRAGTAKAPMRKNIGNDFALRGFVCCDGCDVPLRSSWVKGNTKHYAYYLCQTKTCNEYGKSIPRDMIEGEVGEMIKTLQPTRELFDLTTSMFRVAWDQRREQASEIVKAGKRQVCELDKQIDAFLKRILDASNSTVIRMYEEKVAVLEREKLVLGEKLGRQVEPKGGFDEKLEPVLTFLANPWKLWESGHIAARRTVLKLAFLNRIKYCRNQGARTPEIALPFKALGALAGPDMRSGAGGGTRTRTGTRPNRF